MRNAVIVSILLAVTPAAAWAQAAAPAAATAPAVAPRVTAAAVAKAIRERYYQAAAGERIAAALEAEAEAGAFDALTDGRDLATALSARLRPQDAHFNVVYDPAASQRGPAPGGPRPPAASRAADARANYGFRRVEILPGNIGLIELTGFYDIDFSDPNDPARRAADTALAMVRNADAVIFDLRLNGGGSPAMVGYLVSAFVPKDQDVYNVFHSRRGTQREAPGVFYPTPRTDVPVYVLTSARTGSAAEAFPYTLQAAKRATVVGEASGGAANPGGMVPVGGGFAVFVSSGSPKNPITGENWEGTGVLPDVPTTWDQALTTAQALALKKTLAADPGRRDAAWALDALTAAAPAEDLASYVGAYGEQQVRLQEGRLQVVRGRRPPVVLQPLGEGVFSVAGDPSRRYRFERDGQGRPVALEALSVDGPPARFRRTS